ncbi:MAG: hypothetical protein ACI8ZM_002095 [Crocinitomix sp.]|jgi:hypothetical protein
MKKIIKLGVLKFTVAFAFIACNTALFAQPPGGPPPGGGGTTGSTPPCWEPECVPIDSGLAFLLIAGVLLAVRMLYTRKQQHIA